MREWMIDLAPQAYHQEMVELYNRLRRCVDGLPARSDRFDAGGWALYSRLPG